MRLSLDNGGKEGKKKKGKRSSPPLSLPKEKIPASALHCVALLKPCVNQIIHTTKNLTSNVPP